ncbi:MAG: hypothetical protein LHW59_09025 [Candidatus Cloacimonetes bacterium]|nr:hypothetical protein [Candidatus Cloacimonadota bacterium]
MIDKSPKTNIITRQFLGCNLPSICELKNLVFDKAKVKTTVMKIMINIDNIRMK